MSLRLRLLLFAVGLVTLPGLIFAIVAFSETREVLEREVGIQLQQTSERAADALAGAVANGLADARSWAIQDVMRDLVVGDLDKRVSRFLQTVTRSNSAYLDAVCVDAEGDVIAASSGSWMTRNVSGADGEVGNGLRGPFVESSVGRVVLEMAVAIPDPDAPARSLGRLILFYDWEATGGLLNDVRGSLSALGKSVAALIVDATGDVIGGISFEGDPAVGSMLGLENWRGAIGKRHGSRRIRLPDGAALQVLVGTATVRNVSPRWEVVLVESASEALAPIRRVGATWVAVLSVILLVGLAVAGLLARQFMLPLEEVTQATSEIAARPDQPMPLLPVRSENEVGQLARSFNRMTTELKRSQAETLTAEKFAFAGELAAMVAHEVRTPLTVMRSSAQMLASGKAPANLDRDELAGTIVSEVDRVNRVVDGLIQLARPVEARPAPTSLPEAIERAAVFTQSHAQQKGVRIECALDSEQELALCDPEQIYQVALNLLVNAVQALPRGGRVRIRTLPLLDGAVGFVVEDDGPGLPPELRDRVFNPFVTSREEGTGLGLAFVERVVRAHSGTVDVQSQAGVGTTFAVRLPMAKADS